MQDNQPYNQELLWEVTNYGLEYWHEVFPDSVGKENKNKHFKTHNENTASTTLYNKGIEGGIYIVYNHSSKQGLNPINHVSKERNCTFLEALQWLFEKYNLEVNGKKACFKPINVWKDTDLEVGTWAIEPLPTVEFSKIAPFAGDIEFERHHFVQLKSYSTVILSSKTNRNTQLTVQATPDYPIYAHQGDEFVKLYEPKAPKDDKYINKHSFLGKKPARYCYGWEQLFEDVDELTILSLYDSLKDSTSESQKKALKKDIEKLQLNEVIIATGGSDGLNLASLDYKVIWFNSESEQISKAEYARLSKITKNIYYVPDLDSTGVKQAVKMGMEFINIKMIWIPESLKLTNKKDVTDWINANKYANKAGVKYLFEQLKSVALEFKFWDKTPTSLKINPKKALHFLKYNNFRLEKDSSIVIAKGKEIEGNFLIIKDNVLTRTVPTEVRRFVTDWLESKYFSTEIYNTVVKSNFFNQHILKALPAYEYERKTSGTKHQIYFFKNKKIIVTPDGIFDMNAESSKKYKKFLDVQVWDNNVIDNHFQITAPAFELYQDEEKRQRIKINNLSSNCFKVLINTSRMFWRKDADLAQQDTNEFSINSTKLNIEENLLQEQHLLNKMYCLGYALHQHKIASKTYLVLGMDSHQGKSIKGSHGGTGKSVILKMLDLFLKTTVVDANNIKKDAFPFDGVTPDTQIVNLDDIGMYQNYREFYVMVTDNLIANQKGGVKYNIPFRKSAKIVGTTNYTPNEINGSSERRILPYYTSDYYHKATDEDDYVFSRKISDFLGRDLFDENYTETEFNHDYNFLLQCLQFYLGCETEVYAPNTTMIERNLWQKIGDELKDFFDKFFEEPENCNSWIEKSTVAAQYIEENGGKKTKQQINEALANYCKIKKWGLADKKIRSKFDNSKSVAHYFIDTKNNAPIIETAIATPEQKQLPLGERPDDLPF